MSAAREGVKTENHFQIFLTKLQKNPTDNENPV